MTRKTFTSLRRVPLITAVVALLALGPGGLLAAGDGTPAAADGPPPDVLVVGFYAAPSEGEADRILPVGGLYQGEWVAGERWRDLLPEGADFAVYSLTQGPIGSLHTTALSTHFDPPGFAGWRGTYRITEKSGSLSHYLAVWTADGEPVPWMKVKELDPSSSRYLKIARDHITADGLLEYLAEHELPEEKAQLILVHQLVSVDLDRDGTEEALLSASWDEFNQPGHPRGTPGVFSWQYVLLVRHEGEQDQVIALSEPRDHWYWDHPERLLACADLDRDGRAEVITRPPIPHEAYRIYSWDPMRVLTEYSILLGE